MHFIACVNELNMCFMFDLHLPSYQQRRKLDAVYFYMRSLAASNPFITARESLMTLFEEVRKKVNKDFIENKCTDIEDSSLTYLLTTNVLLYVLPNVNHNCRLQYCTHLSEYI